MHIRGYVFCILALILALPSGAHAMTAAEQERIAQLQAQIDQLEQQAAQYRGNIASERAKADTLKREISILKNQIAQVETQIYITERKIDKTRIEIGSTEEKITDTRERIERRQETIGRLLLFRAEQDRLDIIGNLLKYADLGDFFSELNQAALVNHQLLAAIGDLKDAKAEYEGQRADLEAQKGTLEKLNEDAATKKRALGGTKTSQEQLLKQTKGQEAAYQARLTEIEKAKAAFFKELRELELKVISGGLYIVHITAGKIPARGTKIFQRPEDGSHLTQGYGMTTYARRGAYGGAPHNGVDFAAGFGSPIKAIGDGTIVANGTNDGWGNWIAIQHPNNMVSLYAHMSSFAAYKVGSQVSVGTVIGYEGATGKATGSHLHLSLYKDFFTYIRDKDGALYFNYFDGSLNPLDYM